MVFGTILGSLEAKFGLVGKPRVSSIDFNRSNGAEISTWNMPGAAPLDPLLCGNTAYGNKWVKTQFKVLVTNQDKKTPFTRVFILILSNTNQF